MGLLDFGGGLSDLQGTLATLGGGLLILLGFLSLVVAAFGGLSGDTIPILDVTGSLMDGGILMGLGILITMFAQAME
jgi:hypothetical protein